MSDGPESRRPHIEGASTRSFRDIGVALLLGATGSVLKGLLGGVHVSETAPSDQTDGYRRERRLYLVGFSLALTLTLVPFALVYWSALSHLGLLIAIGVFAFVQIVVHLRCFLHIDPPNQNMDDLELILFSSLILMAMVGGTIWILANLALRMH